MTLARDLWLAVEPIHSLYLDPAGTDSYSAVGLRGGWMRYFAARSCALGPASPKLVEATFYGFAPSLIERAVPDAWSYATPSQVHDARLRAVQAGYERAHSQLLDRPVAEEAAGLAAAITSTFRHSGRPLYAGHAALPTPPSPHLALWWHATLIREFRGDGHIAGLLTRGLDGPQSLAFHAATGEVSREVLQPLRGWTDAEWDAAEQQLRQRGWLDEQGALTDSGAAARRSLEDETDILALPAEAESPAAELVALLEAAQRGS